VQGRSDLDAETSPLSTGTRRFGVRAADFGSLVRQLRAEQGVQEAGARELWVLAGIGIALLGLLPFFVELSTLLLVQQALYLGLLALSLNLLVNTTGLISFGHAMFFAFGAYLVAVPYAKLDWSPLWGLALTPVIGAVAGLVIGLVVLRGAELYFALLTLGVSQLVWATAHGWQSLTGGTNGTTGVFGPEFLSPFLNPNNLYWFIFGIAAFCTLLLYVVTRSPFGDALRGIRENRRRAAFVGLPVKRYELAAFALAGIFGAVAGGLAVVGETQISSGQVNWTRSALALIVALIGGIRYFLGPFAGAIFYIFVFDYIIARTVLWDTVLGIVVLVVALALPGGIVGLIHLVAAQGTVLVGRARGRRRPAVRGAPPADEEAVHLPAAVLPAATDDAGEDGAGPVVLDVEGVTKRFGGLIAVEDATLAVRQGTIHAVIGPNGAGKTTLFNVVTGLLKPDEGRVILEGEDISAMAPWRLVKRGLGRSFQQASLFWSLSAITNVTLARSAVQGGTRRFSGRHPPEVRARAYELLDRVGLAGFADVAASELSHGDQRSLEIATALAVESRLLLLDEPTAGLSPAETTAAVALIKKLAQEEHLTVLFVEHDMEVVFGIADRITVLHRGTVLAEGTPTEIRANPEVRRAYLGAFEESQAAS
jgi:ABC-type branched-subunit amino acid transport system ATPase component/ABC-type branched-subunit amino acid transport system permease subunit